MAQPSAPWSCIPPELLLLISEAFDLLESYCRARGVCAAWRAALPPPIPSLVAVTTVPPGAPLHRQYPHVSAVLLPAARSYPLTTLSRSGRCVGSSNGWLAVDSRPSSMGIYLVNRLAGGKHVLLLHLHNDGNPVPKVVFAPEPTPEDYVAVAICSPRRLAYTKTRDMKWMILDVAIAEGDMFIDLAYDADRVYCVTSLGDVHVLHIPRRQRRRPIVEPLLQAAERRAGQPFDPAAAYAPPYDAAVRFTGAKNVFFVGGDLYQVWRSTASAAVSFPDGGQFGVAKDETFVLKYDPERRPCWDAVKDLGGYSVFIGKNQPVVLRPEDTPGVRGNCVYWINELSRNEPMVFDMATGTSTIHPSADKALNPSCRPVCWYFLNDRNMKMSVEDNGRKRCRSGEDCGQVLKSRKAH